MTRLMLNVPLGAKITIALVDDGFAAQDQDTYDRAIGNLLTNGPFAQDFYRVNKPKFNMLPEHRLTLVLLKNRNFGGCGNGGQATLPLGITWLAIAREFGHALGSLGDEYSTVNTACSGPESWPNPTTRTDRAQTAPRSAASSGPVQRALAGYVQLRDPGAAIGAACLGIVGHGGERRFAAGQSRQCAQRRAVAAPPRARRHSGRVAHQYCRHASADINAANHRIQLDSWECSWS